MRRTFGSIMVAALIAATVVPGATAADDPSGFVRNRVPLEQTLPMLLNGKFYEEVRCLEACTVKTQLGISPEDARRLGFPNVKSNQWHVVGEVTKQLSAGAWTKVYLPLKPDAQTRLSDSKVGVRIAGRLVARSTTSGRYGWASWLRTCKLPPA